MTTQAFGRDQSYARKVNNELVIQKLRKEDLSATELSSTLNLSHAAMSSILKGLLGQGIIKVSCSKSEFGKGRKQVVYSCLLYTSPSPRDVEESRMPSSA